MFEAHLWTYNHSFTGIADQAEFLLDFFKKSGWDLSISTKPRFDRQNFLIENFQPNTSLPLRTFCEKTGLRVGIIMTEHVDFKNNIVMFHGSPWNAKDANSDYMEVGTQMNRLRTLLELSPFIRCILTLGDLPYLNGINNMFVGTPILRIPFPILECVPKDEEHDPEHDFVFSGAMTGFRSSILQSLRNHGWKILVNEKISSRNRRNRLLKSAKIVLNIPQDKDWEWISLMRVYSALKADRATISFTSSDKSSISHCCTQMQIDDIRLNEKLESYLKNWKEMNSEAKTSYNAMAIEYQDFNYDDITKLKMLLD